MLKKLAALFLFAIASLNLKGETSQFLIISKDSGEYNLVVPDELLGKDILFGSRIVDISKPSAKVYAAGQMRRPPVVVRFSKQGDMLLMHEITDFYEVNSKDPIHRAVERNSIIGAAHIFNIDSRNIDGNASIINVTDYFSKRSAWPGLFRIICVRAKLRKNSVKLFLYANSMIILMSEVIMSSPVEKRHLP